MKRIIQQVKGRNEMEGSASWKRSRQLYNRFEETLQVLDYYEVTAGSLLDHQQNLLSLVRVPSLSVAYCQNTQS